VPEKAVERPILVEKHVSVSGKEKPISVIVTCTEFVHITSISPHQTVKLLLFDFVPLDKDKYFIRFFSEYGASGPNFDPTPRFYRACLYLDRETDLKIKITVAGEGLRSPLQFRLAIQKDFLEKIREGHSKTSNKI